MWQMRDVAIIAPFIVQFAVSDRRGKCQGDQGSAEEDENHCSCLLAVVLGTLLSSFVPMQNGTPQLCYLSCESA
jgi:hypothetical protein